MRRFLAAAFLLSLAALPVYATTGNLQVIVTNSAGAPIPGAYVAAIRLSPQGNPDPLDTRIGVTDAQGQYTFTGSTALVKGDVYSVFATSQGFTPTIADQFPNGSFQITAGTDGGTAPAYTIPLNPSSAPLGEIDVSFLDATRSSLVFGAVNLQAGGATSAFGFAKSDASAGFGTMKFLNVAFANSGTYMISLFDPTLNGNLSIPVNADLSAGTPTLSLGGGSPIDFSDGKPPINVISQSQQNGQGGSLSVDGVVVDTNSVPVPNVFLNFASSFQDAFGQSHPDNRGTPTDQNGRFQLFGLQSGATYYTSFPGSCSNNVCYQAIQSTAVTHGLGMAPPGQYDFLYTGSVLSPRIVLQQVPPSSGKMAVYIKDQFGHTFPQAGIGLWPDYSSWQTSGGNTCNIVPTAPPPPSNPGSASFNVFNSTGYVLLTGLPSGNYQLNAWTPYGQISFNNFSFSQNQMQPSGRCDLVADANDIRLAVDTTTANNQVRTYDVYGNQLTIGSSVTVTVNISTSGSGLVRGTLTFPAQEDLSLSPVVITLMPQCSGSQCGNQNSGGFVSFNGSTGPAVNYAIPVSSGNVYWMNILSNYWGAVIAGGGQPNIDLTQSTSAVISATMLPAGRIIGFLRKPDGSVFIPQQGQWVGVNAEGQDSWGNGQVTSDGSFSIGGLIPGIYHLSVQDGNSSSFPYTIKQPVPPIQVLANKDTSQDADLDNSVSVQPIISVSSMPALSISAMCVQNGPCPIETWEVYALAAGTRLDDKSNLIPLLTGGGHNTLGAFDFFASTTSLGGGSVCHDQFPLNSPGFCAASLAARPVSGSAYDFYLFRKGNIDFGNIAAAARPNLVAMATKLGVTVSQARATNLVFSPFGGPGGSTTTVENVPLYPASNMGASGQAVLAGTFTATNIITPLEFSELGGNFENFFQYLPTVFVYDANGAFKAAGLGVPYPPAVARFEKQMKQSVAAGDFAGFMNAINGMGSLGYEIRGLTPGQKYNIVATSFNYPPLKTSVTLGVAQSTTSLDINLDLNQGSSLLGLVNQQGGAALPNASVTVSAPGYEPTTSTTDSTGSYRLDGLGAGQYTVTVEASGFVKQVAVVDVAAKTVVNAPTFTLVAANATITGSVSTNNPICPPGSTGCAAFGRAAIAGATVLAYDDTLNTGTGAVSAHSNSSTALPLYRTVTSSSGTYTLPGLLSGHSFKIFIKAPGYYIVNQSTLSVAGTLTGLNLSLTPQPLSVDVHGYPIGANYEFQITNYKFSSGRAWINQAPWSLATSTEVTSSFVQHPDSEGNNQLLLDYPLSNLSSGKTYVLHLEAQPNDPRAAKVVKELQFGLDLPHNTCQSIDQTLLGDDSENSAGIPNNEVPLDISGGTGGNATGFTLPVGGVIPIFSTAVPTMCITETNAAASTQATTGGANVGAFASGIYSVTLSSVNYTQRGIDSTFAFNQSSGSDLSDLAVYTLDTASQKWKSVPGLQTIDPVKGTITVKGLKSLSSVLDVRRGASLMAVSDGRGYRPNAASLLRPDDSGIFAVLKPSQVSGGSFSGTIVKIFNFPNPFNLQTKSVALAAGGSACSGGVGPIVTNGTVIKYEIPAGISGTGVVRVYTVSGRLVREIDAGNISPSSCYYTTWDGKNKNGQPVANGVYFGVLSVGGSKLSSGTFKMAVIK